MSYYKKVNTTTTCYYNIMDGLITEIVESEDLYKVRPSDKDETWIKANADEIEQGEFETKADNVSDYAKLGTHPPHAPH